MARLLLMLFPIKRRAQIERILIIDDVRDRATWLKANLEQAEYGAVGVLDWEMVDEYAIQAASGCSTSESIDLVSSGQFEIR